MTKKTLFTLFCFAIVCWASFHAANSVKHQIASAPQRSARQLLKDKELSQAFESILRNKRQVASTENSIETPENFLEEQRPPEVPLSIFLEPDFLRKFEEMNKDQQRSIMMTLEMEIRTDELDIIALTSEQVSDDAKRGIEEKLEEKKQVFEAVNATYKDSE